MASCPVLICVFPISKQNVVTVGKFSTPKLHGGISRPVLTVLCGAEQPNAAFSEIPNHRRICPFHFQTSTASSSTCNVSMNTEQFYYAYKNCINSLFFQLSYFDYMLR